MSEKQPTSDVFSSVSELKAKTFEEWEAEEKAERATTKGKIKWAYLDYVYYPLYRFFRRLSEIPEDIHAFWQRGRRGWADSDAWGIDSYLDSFMPEMLRRMIDNKNGGGNTYPGEGTEGAETYKKWHRIVEKMARGFEAGRKIEDITYSNVKDYRKKYEKLKKQQDEGLALFIKYYNHLWD